MEKPDYSIGEHLKWEAALHERRRTAAESGAPLTDAQELRFIAHWMDEHKKDSNVVTVCSVCSEQIADALLKHCDPFLCPPCIKEEIKAKMRQLFYKRGRAHE